jgi:hypothetical protein
VDDDISYREEDYRARNRVAAAKYRRRQKRAHKDAIDLNEELYVKCKAMEVELRRVQDENLVSSSGWPK